ncbi:hypothetical protein OAU00_02945 [Saprospiraceae bacterium]|nr:hypothetical protein [bacterium]MDC3220023.1 hypothetical protein [Saprospiraceae bacterium]
MTLIPERTVQNNAQEYLEKKYRRKARGNRVFSKIEMATKKKYGSKRADGFLAFRHYFWGNIVVSLEAKSKKTLPALKPYRDEFIMIKNCLEMGFYCCLGSGAFFAFFKMDNLLLRFLIPTYTLLISALIYGLLTWRSYRHQTMDVIDQLKQYPANEKWLAFSKDSFESLSKNNQTDLKKICKARGIGLMLYGRKIKVIHRPRFHWNLGKDFIKYYSREKDVREALKN